MALRALCSISLLCYGCDNYIVSVLGIQFSLSLPELLYTFPWIPSASCLGDEQAPGFRDCVFLLQLPVCLYAIV